MTWQIGAMAGTALACLMAAVMPDAAVAGKLTDEEVPASETQSCHSLLLCIVLVDVTLNTDGTCDVKVPMRALRLTGANAFRIFWKINKANGARREYKFRARDGITIKNSPTAFFGNGGEGNEADPDIGHTYFGWDRKVRTSTARKKFAYDVIVEKRLSDKPGQPPTYEACGRLDPIIVNEN